MKPRVMTALAVAASLGVALGGCSQETLDPLLVTNSAAISDITDNTHTGWYTVNSATLSTNAIGTTLKLGFSIVKPNHASFSPISTITFADGTVLTCQADDARRVPSLVMTTDTWDFACDAAEFPKNGDGASLIVVDDYN